MQVRLLPRHRLAQTQAAHAHQTEEPAVIALVAITIARAHGIVVPRIAWSAARRAGIPYALLLAVLDQESGGGANEFGHDPTIFAGAGPVTRIRYLVYKAERDRTGLMQGVGPVQLTWRGYQDAADQLGGCWQPACNVAIGAHILAENIRRRDGLHAGVAAYNGAGPAAQRYADQVLERADRWRAILNPPRPRIRLPFAAQRKETKIPC